MLADLAESAAAEDLADVTQRYQRLNRSHAVIAATIGLVFGLAQNRFVVGYLFGNNPISALDLAFLLGNALLWAAVALILTWKLTVSFALRRLGAKLDVDVYQLHRLRPLGVLAALDVLAVAGTLIMMPLQALDAEFRMENYQWGLLVGIPAAIALFVLPLLGVRQQIRQAKAIRLAELDALQPFINRDDVAQLELFEAHRHRIEGLPNWPIDLQLVIRIMVYVVLPPLAWVAAALVEQVVDRFS